MKRKKQAITLLEIMIVIFLIGLIGGIVGYNMKGSLTKGRAIKTKLAIEKIKEILYLEAAERAVSLEQVAKNHEEYLKKSGFFKNKKEILSDGWGEKIEVKFDAVKGDLNVSSLKLSQYNAQKAVSEPQAVAVPEAPN